MNTNTQTPAQSLQRWLQDHPHIAHLQAAVCDLNGVMRGKLIPRSQAQKLAAGVRLPVSALGIDIWGEDTIGSGHVFETGDGDGICEFTGRGPVLLSWLDRPSAFLPLWMLDDQGRDATADPRRALARVCAQYQQAGLVAVVATELEFYLVDAQLDERGQPQPAQSAYSGRPTIGGALYAIDEIQAYESFIVDVYEACEAQGIAADAAISENGNGQFEINLLHKNDPLAIADDTVLFKRLVKGIARKHGYRASFMAKPYGRRAGSGMHVHFSILDKDGRNIFDDGTHAGTPALRHALAGCIAAADQCTLIFAPHANSYRRLRRKSHAPIAICWGYENRTALLRIPGGAPKARRIEHRAAGADTNAYLVLAAILGAALQGIEGKMCAPEPITGNAYEASVPRLPLAWQDALDCFADGAMVPKLFNPTLQQMFIACKEQEMQEMASQVSEFEIRSYLDSV